MTADYFQDIVPPEGEQKRPVAPAPQTAPVPADEGEKSIRNINITRSRPQQERIDARFMPKRPSFRPTKTLWVIAALAVVMVGGLSLFAFRKTTVTVVPRTHTIVFDNTVPFTAYPADTAASGTLPYTVQSFTFDDSEVVPAQGTHHVETKASGSITVVNDYSATPVKLLATTRFETPDGLVFRAPNQVIVPGKKGSTPGTMQVTVVADAVGESYNVGPIAKFTLPGLKGGPMYTNVYAKSDAAFTGGFNGEQPQTAPGALEAAVAQIRGRLDTKYRSALGALASSTTALPELARVSYTDMPNTPEGDSSVRVREQITVQVPVFSTDTLANTLAQSYSADASIHDVNLVPGSDFAVAPADAASTTLGSDPVSFTLNGKAQLVWRVDSAALAGALAGHDQGAFQTIIGGFPFVQEAKARIEPFWATAFPKNPGSIIIVVQPAPQV